MFICLVYNVLLLNNRIVNPKTIIPARCSNLSASMKMHLWSLPQLCQTQRSERHHLQVIVYTYIPELCLFIVVVKHPASSLELFPD